MGGTAVWTAAHYGLPLLIVVANNAFFYNDVVHAERVAAQRQRPPRSPPPRSPPASRWPAPERTRCAPGYVLACPGAHRAPWTDPLSSAEQNRSDP